MFIRKWKSGIFHLEDPTGSMRIDLTAAAATSGMFCENCVVIATGEVRKTDGIFEVTALGHPPAETRRKTLESDQRQILWAPRKVENTSRCDREI